MGNTQQRLLTGNDPVQGGWQIKEKNEQFNVWRNPDTGEEVDEYRRLLSDRRQYEFERQTFSFRFNSSTLVASVYLKEEAQYDMCSTFYKANLFLEHINHRLSDIDHIPYPDVLHMYQQAFRGFAELFDRVGYFEVEEDLICINQHGKVKVWLNRDLSRAVPEPLFAETQPSESNMIRKIINVVHSSTDTLTLPENILDTMRRNSVSTFREADAVLTMIAARHRTAVPSRLDCVLEMDSQFINEVRKTTVTSVPVTQLPVRTVTTVAGAIPTAPLHTVAAVQTPVVQTSLVKVPAVTIPAVPVSTFATVPRYSLPIQAARTARVCTIPGLITDKVKPLSSGYIQTSSSQGSRLSCSPVIAKPATAVTYNTFKTSVVGNPITVGRGAQTIVTKPPLINKTVPTRKSASAISFNTSVKGVSNKPISRPPIRSYLPVISEKSAGNMKRTSGTVTAVNGRAPSVTSVSVPSSTGASVGKGIDVQLVSPAHSTILNDNWKTAQFEFNKNKSTPPAQTTVPTKATQQKYKFTIEGNATSSPINIAKTIDITYKPVESTSTDFYSTLGLNQQKDSVSTNFNLNNGIAATSGLATTDYKATYEKYEPKQETTYQYQYSSYGQVSPSPIVQPITHTNISTPETFSFPVSVSLNTQTVNSSIPVTDTYEYKGYQYGQYKSSLAETSSLTPNLDYLNTQKQETYKTQSLSSGVATQQKDYNQLTSYSPPKVEFTYSSSQIPSSSQVPSGSGYSRTIYEGTAQFSYENANYGNKGYEVTTETYKAQISTTGPSSSGAIAAIDSTVSSYLPSVSSYGLTSNEYTYTAANVGGVSPPSSRVALTLMNLSPTKTKGYQEVTYTATYQETISSYGQSQSGYQSSSYGSLQYGSQPSNVPAISSNAASYQPYSVGSYQSSTRGSYQTASSTAPESSNYNLQMDTDLLKDLQKLKKQGTLSPQRDGSPSRNEDFNTGVSFGNNSGYIRDSLKPQVL